MLCHTSQSLSSLVCWLQSLLVWNVLVLSARTTKASTSGSHVGHDKAEARGDSESATAVSWPRDNVVLMMLFRTDAP